MESFLLKVELMKKNLTLSVIVIIFQLLGSLFLYGQKNTTFKKGEELTFKVSYGFLDAAEAKMIIGPNLTTFNNKPAYKIDIFGKTLGIFKLFKVNDNWGTYLDTAKIIPHQSYRHIEEGKYRKHEQVLFNHQNRNAIVRLYDRNNRMLVDTKDYPIPHNVQDLVSGFYHLRTMDMKKYKPGDTIKIVGFFDKEIHNLKLIYEGKQIITTSLGKFETLIFSPIMPKNKLFRGDHPVKIWVSNDENKIPLRINARLMVGSLNMEITEAKGLRNN